MDQSRFAYLLQPIRDLTKNWDIDVASQLEEYISEVRTNVHECISEVIGTTAWSSSQVLAPLFTSHSSVCVCGCMMNTSSATLHKSKTDQPISTSTTCVEYV